MTENEIEQKAEEALHRFIGEGTTFRDGQLEAIAATLTNRRTLVVQRTGWGKSMVYFICTKLLRDMGNGVTVIVSPLLALMDNQIAAAEKAGLKCKVINGNVKGTERESVIQQIENNKIDIVLTTPETLFNIYDRLNPGFFVIDEAHCISDWGHDFRLEYCRLKEVIKKTPVSVPILATTATANDRVIEDLKEQLGGDVFVSRGPLMRNNLSIQVLNLNSKIERYAWMLENIPKLLKKQQGSGIVYCLTQNDCDEIAKFLNENGICAKAYYGDKDDNEQIERDFMDNKIQVLVATIKLGMGYDKGDISFVIHYQTPSSIVAYYQQIGRAGRHIDRAYTFLMNGTEDERIHEFFRESAFPSEDEAEAVYNYISNGEDFTGKEEDGARLNDVLKNVEYSKNRIVNALKFLINEHFIYSISVEDTPKKKHNEYFLNKPTFTYNKDNYDEIIKQREEDYNQMQEMIGTKKCYNRFIVNALNDNTQEDCGICENCTHSAEFPEKVSHDSEAYKKAVKFFEEYKYPITPRKKRPDMKSLGYINQEGISLSRFGYLECGRRVKVAKKTNGMDFDDFLLERSVEVLTPFIKEKSITALTYVPSKRSNVVRNFAEKLAKKLGIPCLELLMHTGRGKPQDEIPNNSFMQYENALKSFNPVNGTCSHKNILLVDDVVNSRWTLTVCGLKLMEKFNVENVYPFALAEKKMKDDE